MKRLFLSVLLFAATPAWGGTCLVIPHVGGFGVVWTIVPVKSLKLGQRTYEEILRTESSGVSVVGPIWDGASMDQAQAAYRDALARQVCEPVVVTDLPTCSIAPRDASFVGLYGQQAITDSMAAQQAEAWRSNIVQNQLCQ